MGGAVTALNAGWCWVEVGAGVVRAHNGGGEGWG